MNSNPYEDAGRLAKVVKLIAAAKQVNANSDQLAAMTNEQWAMLEQIADVKPTSETTRDLTMLTMRNVERAAQRTTRAFPKY